MPKLSNIKFQKYSIIGNPVFIAREENENYYTIKDIADKLVVKYSTFLPFYHNEQYNFSTIRFIKDSKFKPEENCFYDIEYKVTQKTKDEKVFINCYIQKMKFISKNIYDIGEEIEV